MILTNGCYQIFGCPAGSKCYPGRPDHMAIVYEIAESRHCRLQTIRNALLRNVEHTRDPACPLLPFIFHRSETFSTRATVRHKWLFTVRSPCDLTQFADSAEHTPDRWSRGTIHRFMLSSGTLQRKPIM